MTPNQPSNSPEQPTTASCPECGTTYSQSWMNRHLIERHGYSYDEEGVVALPDTQGKDELKNSCGYCRRRPPLKWCKRHTPQTSSRRVKLYTQAELTKQRIQAVFKYVDSPEHKQANERLVAQARRDLLDELEALPQEGNRSLSVKRLRDFINAKRKEGEK